MAKQSDPLAWLQRAAERVAAAETELDAARAERLAAIRAAHDAGASYSAIGRVVGVTRQRVMRVLREGE